MVHDAGAEVAVPNDDDVIFHLARKHAAALLGVVALDGLKEKKRNNNSEKDALSPERVDLPELAAVHAQIKCAEKRIAEREIREMSERKCSERKPKRQECESPAALAEKKFEAYPEKAAHEVPMVGMLGGAEAQVNGKKWANPREMRFGMRKRGAFLVFHSWSM